MREGFAIPCAIAVAFGLAGLAAFPQPSEAGIAQNCVVKPILKALRDAQFWSIKHGVPNLQNQIIKVTEGGVKRRYRVGAPLDAGSRGTIYDVTFSPPIPGLSPTDGDYILKVPHHANLGGRIDLPLMAASTRREISNDRLFARSLPEIEAHPEFPKNPHWRTGTLPVATIPHSFDTGKGMMLIKRKIRSDQGLRLKQIGAIVEENGGAFPPKMEKQLRSIYQAGQAIRKTVQLDKGGWVKRVVDRTKAMLGRAPSAPRLKPFYPDLAAPNFIWVTDPVLQKELGLKGPGFAMFELDHTLGNIDLYGSITEDAYIAEFKQRALDELAESRAAAAAASTQP